MQRTKQLVVAVVLVCGMVATAAYIQNALLQIAAAQSGSRNARRPSSAANDTSASKAPTTRSRIPPRPIEPEKGEKDPTKSGSAGAKSEKEATRQYRPAPRDRTDHSRVVSRIISQTNAFRRSEGLAGVSISPDLQATAEYFAQFMAREHKYGHKADGHELSERVTDHKYDYCVIAENIAYQYSSAGFSSDELADQFFEGWKESPGHRKNMLGKHFTETGVAIARGSTGYYFAVQLFGRPRSLSFVFKIVNQSAAAVRYKLDEKTFTLEPRYTQTHTQCLPSELTFLFKPEHGGEKRVNPVDGDRYVVGRSRERFTVEKLAAEKNTGEKVSGEKSRSK